MAKKTPEVNIRAYDLGGFGDIAGAMRVASFLQKRGLQTQMTYCQKSAYNKLRILNPDTTIKANNTANLGRAIQIDIAGHYRDPRVGRDNSVPHTFTEDMDNSQDRKKETPLYLKSGLKPRKNTLPLEIRATEHVPMFYRPFREWELPKPEQRDARAQIMETYTAQQTPIRKLKNGAIRALKNTDKIGFAHVNPGMDIANLFSHPYFSTVKQAHRYSPTNFGIGVFFNAKLEEKIATIGKRRNWNIIRSNGTTENYDQEQPSVFCLGPQTQTKTTGLFLSANMPNLVTGDLSLSDAMYGLIAMQGPAFFYETAPWKTSTLTELSSMIKRSSKKMGQVFEDMFLIGSNSKKFYSLGENLKELYRESIENVTKTFIFDSVNKQYREVMQEAIRKEIRKRFGNVQVQAQGISKGFYIQPGAQYLLQDATESIIDTLREDQTFFAKVEKTRERMSR